MQKVKEGRLLHTWCSLGWDLIIESLWNAEVDVIGKRSFHDLVLVILAASATMPLWCFSITKHTLPILSGQLDPLPFLLCGSRRELWSLCSWLARLLFLLKTCGKQENWRQKIVPISYLHCLHAAHQSNWIPPTGPDTVEYGHGIVTSNGG